MATRWSLLEIDENPEVVQERLRRAEKAEREAAAAREAEAERESRAAALRYEADIARREAEAIEQRNESVQRRSTATQTRVQMRKAKAAEARGRKNAKEQANAALYDLNHNHYWRDKYEGMGAMRNAVLAAGYELTGEIWNEGGSDNEGRLSYAILTDSGDERALHIQWYRMPSGKWELNAYVN